MGYGPDHALMLKVAAYVLPVMVGLRQHRLVVEQSLTGGIAF
jgi:hypothetical protein